MVIKESLGSIHLIETQTLCIDELIKVVIVYKDKNLIFVAI